MFLLQDGFELLKLSPAIFVEVLNSVKQGHNERRVDPALILGSKLRLIPTGCMLPLTRAAYLMNTDPSTLPAVEMPGRAWTSTPDSFSKIFAALTLPRPLGPRFAIHSCLHTTRSRLNGLAGPAWNRSLHSQCNLENEVL
jgi:hypothetical protein